MSTNSASNGPASSPSSNSENTKRRSKAEKILGPFILISEISFQILDAYLRESWAYFFILPLTPIFVLCGLTVLYSCFPTTYQQLQYHGSFILACGLLSISINLFIRYYASNLSEVIRQKGIGEINFLLSNVSLPVSEPSFTSILSTLIKPPVYAPAHSVPLSEYCTNLNSTHKGREILFQVYRNQTPGIASMLGAVLTTFWIRSFFTLLGIALCINYLLIKLRKKEDIDLFIMPLVVAVAFLSLPMIDSYFTHVFDGFSTRHQLLPLNFCERLVESYGTFFTQHGGPARFEGQSLIFVSVCTLAVMLMRRPARILAKHWLVEYALKEIINIISVFQPIYSYMFVSDEIRGELFSLEPSSVTHRYQRSSFRAYFFLVLITECSAFMHALPIYFPRTPVDLSDSTTAENPSFDPLQSNQTSTDSKITDNSQQTFLSSPTEAHTDEISTSSQTSQESVAEGAPYSTSVPDVKSFENSDTPQVRSAGSLMTELNQRNFLMREHENPIVNTVSLVLFAGFMYSLDTYSVWCFSLRFFSNDKWIEPAAFVLKVFMYSVVLGFIRHGNMCLRGVFFSSPLQRANPRG